MTAVAQRAPRAENEDDERAELVPPWQARLVRLRTLLSVGVPTVLTAAHAALYGPWIEDDAGITFSFARNVASGNGFVHQAGATPVEGFSDPLWLGILVVGHWLGLFDHGAWFGLPDIVLFPKLVALLCCLGIFVCFHGIARAVWPTAPWRAALAAGGAGVVVACIPSFVAWSFSGLENALYALLVVALAAVLVRGHLTGRLLDARIAAAAGLCAAGAALTRPDGLIYVAAFPAAVLLLARADAAWLRRSSVVTSVVAFAVPTMAWLVLRLIVFGDWLPNTARAKAQGTPTMEDLAKPADLVGVVGWLLVTVLAVMVVLVLTRRSPARDALIVLLVPLGLAVAVYGLLERDWMGLQRFATPVWPLATLIGVIAFVAIVPALARPQRIGSVLVAGIALVLSLGVWVPAADSWADGGATAPMCTGVGQNEVLMTNGVADRLGLPSSSTLFMVDAGATGLGSRLRFVDGQGLVDARIARFWQAGDMTGLRNYVLTQVRPTMYLVYGTWDETDPIRRDPNEDLGRARGPHIRDDPRFLHDYVQVWSRGPALPLGGIWVRRDAVRDAATLASARAYVIDTFTRIGQLYPTKESLVQTWTCGPVMRPGMTLESISG